MSTLRLGTSRRFVDQEQVGMQFLGERDGRSFAEIQIVGDLALSPDKSVRGHFHGTSACLSALFAAGRYNELVELVRGDIFWPY